MLSVFVLSHSAVASVDGLVADQAMSETIVDRFSIPPGFTRVQVDDDSYQAWLRSLTLLPHGTNGTDWQSRHVFDADEVGGVLNWRLLGSEEQCADIALRLHAEHVWDKANGQALCFRSLSGDDICWPKWLQGRYSTNSSQTAIVYKGGTSRPRSRDEFDRYLSFVMMYTNTASMSRDWPIVTESELTIGDVFIQPHCTGPGMGHLSVVVDACVNPDGERRFLFVDGYTPALLPVVRQRIRGQQESVWMTLDEYLQLQQQFGPGVFHRFSSWSP